MSKQVTEVQIEKSLKPSKLRRFFNEHLTSKFKTADCHNCAIARYLQSEFKTTRGNVRVGEEITVKGVSSYLPDWALKFISKFDDEPGTFVTGKKSLQILLDVAYRTA